MRATVRPRPVATRPALLLALALATTCLVGPVPAGATPPALAAAAAASTTGPSAFVPLTSTRLLDTRTGVGTRAGRVAPRGSVRLPVLRRGGVPAEGVTAVVLNVTITQTRGPGFVQVLPTGRSRAGAFSHLNHQRPGQTVAGLVTTPLGDDGTVTVRSEGGGHLLADVLGYYVASGATSAGRFVPLTPARLLDTRAGGARSASRLTRDLRVRGRGGVPSTGAAAVVLNVTAAGASGPVAVQVRPAGSRPGTASTVHAAAGQTVANLTVVRLGAAGSISLSSSRGTHLVVDVVGYTTDASAPRSTAGLFVPVDPVRVVDTRATRRKPGAGSTTPVGLASLPHVPAGGATAAALTLTAVGMSGPGHVSVLHGGSGRASTSTLNVQRTGQVVANAAVAGFGRSGRAGLWTSTPTHLVADLVGYYLTSRGSASHPGRPAPGTGTPTTASPSAPAPAASTPPAPLPAATGTTPASSAPTASPDGSGTVLPPPDGSDESAVGASGQKDKDRPGNGGGNGGGNSGGGNGGGGSSGAAPAPTPSPTPSPSPSPSPTAVPTTPAPSSAPPSATPSPSPSPSPSPTVEPTIAPTTAAPSPTPATTATRGPAAASESPTPLPSLSPTPSPTASATPSPTPSPTPAPTTPAPTTPAPTPTTEPSLSPAPATQSPAASPSPSPADTPTPPAPTPAAPSPTLSPTPAPTSQAPEPTTEPSLSPAPATQSPTAATTASPTPSSPGTASGPQPFGNVPGSWRLTFADEFSGSSIDRATWKECYAFGCSNWPNGEGQNYSFDSVRLSDGMAHLVAEDIPRGDKPYSSGMINSRGSYSFSYGYAEARVKMPAGQGMWPAFWLSPEDGTWPPEIDVIELLGQTPTEVMRNYHWRDADGWHKSSFVQYPNPDGIDWTKDFHTFGVLWEPGKLTWFLDGVAVNSLEGDMVSGKPMHLIANLAVGSHWGGYPNATTTWPSTFSLDHIRVWQHP